MGCITIWPCLLALGQGTLQDGSTEEVRRKSPCEHLSTQLRVSQFLMIVLKKYLTAHKRLNFTKLIDGCHGIRLGSCELSYL